MTAWYKPNSKKPIYRNLLKDEFIWSLFDLEQNKKKLEKNKKKPLTLELAKLFHQELNIPAEVLLS